MTTSSLPGSGSFSIDGKPPTIVPLPVSSGFVSEPGLILFYSGEIDPTARHWIEAMSVFTSGEDASFPTLTIQSLIISNGTIPASNISTTSGSRATVSTTILSSSTNLPSALSFATQTATTTTIDPGSLSTPTMTVSSRPIPHTVVPIIAGTLGSALFFVLCLVFALAYRRHNKIRTSVTRSPQLPRIEPFASDSITIRQDSARYRCSTASGIKEVRRLLISTTDNTYEPQFGIIPPAKLSCPPTSTTPFDNAPNTEMDVSQSYNTPGPSQPRRVITRVQEEDSGLRTGSTINEEKLFSYHPSILFPD